MVSTPIELRTVTPSHLLGHHQSLLPTDSPIGTQRHRGWSSRWHSLPWKYEILSWLASLCFFIGIVVALVRFNGHAIPDLPLGITPNAIIQILETFGEFFLLIPVTSAIGQLKWLRALQTRPMYEFRVMDEASRGPWGSFVLVIRRKAGLIASFGALIIMINLGTSTFVQQALVYSTIYTNTSDASVRIAKYMNGTGTGFTAPTATTNGIDAEVQAGANVGLYSPAHTNFTVSSQCSTGNCTWESYRTLAVCNTCANLTSSLTRTRVHIEIDNNPQNAYTTDYYGLRNGFILNGLSKVTTDGNLFASVLNITTSINDSGDGSPFSSIAFSTNASVLLGVFAIGLSPDTIPEEPDSDSTAAPLTGEGFGSPLAFECLLQFCVQEIRAEFQNGTLNETVLSTYTNNTQFSPGLPNSEYADTVLQPPDSGDTFIATALAVDATSSWLSYFLTGSATIATNSGDINLQRVTATQSAIEPIVVAMNNSATGFPDIMDNIAKSISRDLRTISYQPPPLQGLAFSPTTRARIVWAWLALPFFLLAASLVFLIIVIVETKRKGLVPWTSNILAALFHGIDKRSSDHQAYETEQVMEKEAKKLLVEFQPHEDGGRLVAAKP